jgi:phospholipid N-methyltransferase
MVANKLDTGLLFFRRFLDNPRTVGAVLPSTRRLGDEMVRGLALRADDVVVEYGCGTGSLTASIAELVRATPGARFLGIEREPRFVDVLRARFPDLEFVRDDVENVAALLAERGLPPPRAVLSGLPLILLPTMEQIVATTAAVLAPGGEFRTFSYIQSWPMPAAFRLRRLLRERFAEHGRSRLVIGNVPPAWVLRGIKSSTGAAAVA